MSNFEVFKVFDKTLSLKNDNVLSLISAPNVNKLITPACQIEIAPVILDENILTSSYEKVDSPGKKQILFGNDGFCGVDGVFW